MTKIEIVRRGDVASNSPEWSEGRADDEAIRAAVTARARELRKVAEQRYQAMDMERWTEKGKIEIEIKPGAELDQAVAEAIGLRWIPGTRFQMEAWWHEEGWCKRKLPAYSRDLNEAFAAAKQVSSYFYLFTAEELDGKWECKLTRRDGFRELVHAETPALAICAAILKLRRNTMPLSVTRDELDRVAALLDEFAKEACKEVANADRSVAGKRSQFEEAMAYEIAAVRPRHTQLQA